jgi:hypothetical protein
MPKVLAVKTETEPEKPIFECCICLDKKDTINQPCGLNVHRICRQCITSIIKKIPISENKPNITCQYPFSDCESIYGKTFVKAILKDAYPVYKIARNSYIYSDCDTVYCPGCGVLLVFENRIDRDMIYECASCEGWYCFTCREENSDVTASFCKKCSSYENINPFAFNYFFYKENPRIDMTDYFYTNLEITPDVACEQIVQKITDVAVRCPVCITPMQRSEQCNSLKHCHTEVCFNCGRFSKIGQDLEDHWSARGHGCARWYTDPIYKELLPSFKCSEGVCYSHITGDCVDPSHSGGKTDHVEFKKIQFMYHSLKSLLPRTRYETIRLLPEEFKKYVPGDTRLDEIDCSSEHVNTKFHMKQ